MNVQPQQLLHRPITHADQQSARPKPGIIHQPVKRPILPANRFYQSRNRFDIGKVGSLKIQSPLPRRGHKLHFRIQGIRRAAGNRDDLKTIIGQFFSNPKAKAPAAAGHDDITH